MLTNLPFHALKWLLFAVLLRAVNQVLMKLIAVNWDWTPVTFSDGAIFCCVLLILAARALSWQRAISYIPLSIAYPFFAVTLITLMVSGHLIFDEQITFGNWSGMVLIAIGILIIAKSSQDAKDP